MAAHAHTDPIDNAGLFIGRQAGAVPWSPPGADTTFLTRCADHCLAFGILLVEVVLVASVWGPQPIGWLWVASQVAYLASSVGIGLLVGFVGMLATLALTVAILSRLDHAWKLTRRAAGCDQREGVLERLFVVATALVVPAFFIWLLVIEGPGSLIFPMQAA